MGALAFPGVLWARIPHGRLTKFAASVAVATVLVGGASLIPGSTTTPVSPSGVDVWMSPSGNDATCTRGDQSFPCLTFTGALAVAQSGDTVLMQDGWYGCESIASNTKTVTFEGDGTGTTAGNVPWVACTSNAYALKLGNVSNLTFQDIWISGLSTCLDCASLRYTADHITLTNTHITCNDDATHFLVDSLGECGAGFENGSHYFTMTGGEVGPTTEGIGWGGSHSWGNHAVFSGIHFHTNRCGVPTAEGCHSEEMYFYAGNPVTISNNFYDGWYGTTAIYFTEYLGDPGPSNVTIENNYISPNASGSTNAAITVGTFAAGTHGYHIRYNTVYNGIYTDNASNDSEEIGNVSGYVQCPGGWTVAYNVYGDDLGRGCGTNSVTVASTSYTCSGCGFDTTTGQLQAGSVALGAGDPSDYPATDIDGDARPLGAAVDAGSDESSLG